MAFPTATYRLQFRNGMTFDRVAKLAPYLEQLGISHLYASPIFTATQASTHGYDVTNPNEIEPTIGGREGFERMVDALKARGIGIILDIVPNHMAASLENPWWHDVVEHGANSRYARHFDVDWSRRLTLPFLGDDFDTVLEAGELSVRTDPSTGQPTLAYYDNLYPLARDTVEDIGTVEATDHTTIRKLHDRQAYELMSWRDAPTRLSYRRFFEIAGLVGVRVEQEDVFDDTHKLILELVDVGKVDGLRIDHVDGLADPKAYLDRLRRKVGADCYIIVEKILGDSEQISGDWPISGTTGYEFIASLANVLVDPRGLTRLTEACDHVRGTTTDLEQELCEAKAAMVDYNFAGEFAALLRLAVEIGQSSDLSFDLTEEQLRPSLRELLIAFPVYRTYGTGNGLSPADRELLATILDKANSSEAVRDRQALLLLERILIGAVPSGMTEKASLFRTRFQQLTGPLMAKSVEDTLFFRDATALALNEVGSEPLHRVFSLDRFHADMASRQEREPAAMSGTSTHDTKRGEDARARLHAITEAPELWAESVERWREINREHVQKLADGLAPEPSVEWMLYQSLAGAWPINKPDQTELKILEERFLAFVEKALREAKLRTNWTDPDEEYEAAVIAYARRLLSRENSRFLDDFSSTLQPFIHVGLLNGLTQTIVKLTAPGIPDIYQGSEYLDLSLVDPDNRREPDFENLERQIAQSKSELPHWQSGKLKMPVIAALLRLRREDVALFAEGTYMPLEAEGARLQNVLAFARADEARALIIIAPRLVLKAIADEARTGEDALRSDFWTDTEISLPDRLAHRSYRDVLTGDVLHAEDTIQVPAAFLDRPFAVLLAE